MRLWARQGTLSWHWMRDDMARSECGLGIPFEPEKWEQVRSDEPPKQGRICRRCKAIITGDEKALRRMERASRGLTMAPRYRGRAW